jgi:membrane associated rhomboid family serine protease
MIIPLSHDSGEVRRQPWVTYGIILSCVLVFLVTHVMNSDVNANAERLVEDAYEYWAAHPYLEPAPRLTEITGDRGSATREEFWEESGESPVPASSLEMEQKRFDELTEQAFAALEKHPWYRFGLIPSAPTATGLFAHMFLHGGWLHLIPNLLFLFLTGSFIEDRWGRGLYALFYVAAGVSGAVLFAGKHPGFEGPLIGASGAIAGAMGAFLVCFARTKIKFFYWLGFFFGTFSAPAWLMLPLWFTNELFTASLMDAINPGGGGGGIAYWAHVGGFGFGVAAALMIRFSGIEARQSKKPEGEWTCDHDSVHADAMAARAEGRAEEALELLRFALEGDPHDPDLALAFFETAAGLGRLEEGSAVLAPAIWREVRAGEREVAVSHWLALCEAGARVSAEPALLFRLAGWLRDAKNADAASAALQCVLEACPGDPIIAIRVARLARSIDPVTALEAAEIALEAPGLEPAERDVLEAIVAGTGARVEPIALESSGDSEPSLEPEEESDPGAVDLSVISADSEPGGPEAEPVWAPEFDRGLMDLSEISTEAPQAAEFAERIDLLEEPLARDAFGDQTELFEVVGADPSEKEEPEICEPSIRRILRVIEAIPRQLDEAAIWLDVDGKGRTRLPLSRVDAVAAVGVHGLSRKAVILIDLALDWTADGEKPLTVLRLRSDRYDPRALVGNAGSPLQAIGRFVSALITRARALPLPDPGSARGEPFKIFRDLAGYEEQVLRAERPPVDDIF